MKVGDTGNVNVENLKVEDGATKMNIVGGFGIVHDYLSELSAVIDTLETRLKPVTGKMSLKPCDEEKKISGVSFVGHLESEVGVNLRETIAHVQEATERLHNIIMNLEI